MSKFVPIPTLSFTNPTQTGLEFNLGLCRYAGSLTTWAMAWSHDNHNDKDRYYKHGKIKETVVSDKPSPLPSCRWSVIWAKRTQIHSYCTDYGYYRSTTIITGILRDFCDTLEPAAVALGLSAAELDVCGSVHHSIIHKENPTRCNSVSKFYFIFIWSSTCFGRHASHH